MIKQHKYAFCLAMILITFGQVVALVCRRTRTTHITTHVHSTHELDWLSTRTKGGELWTYRHQYCQNIVKRGRFTTIYTPNVNSQVIRSLCRNFLRMFIISSSVSSPAGKFDPVNWFFVCMFRHWSQQRNTRLILGLHSCFAYLSFYIGGVIYCGRTSWSTPVGPCQSINSGTSKGA